jgi:hypothetical protein
MEDKRDALSEKLSSCRRSCEHAKVEKGRVEELRPGRNGKVRTVIHRTQDGGRLVRSVQLVIPLEVDQGGEYVEDVEL